MAFKTVDINRWNDVVIAGETIQVRCLTNGQLQRLSEAFDAAESNVDAKLAVIAPYVRIKGIAVPMEEYLPSLVSVSVQMEIITAVFGQNGLSVAEAKNSGSLSDGSKAGDPARHSTTTTLDVQPEMAASASPTRTALPVDLRQPVTPNSN